MVENAAKGEIDVKKVNAGQDCSNTELRIVGNSNKLVYLTSRITALSFMHGTVGVNCYIFCNCLFSVSRHIKIITTVQFIKSRIGEKKEGKYAKTFAKIQGIEVTAIFLNCMETP